MSAPVRIRVSRLGGYQIDGAFELVDGDGAPIATPRADRVSLCRCGASARPPFCDGSHYRVAVRSADADADADAATAAADE